MKQIETKLLQTEKYKLKKALMECQRIKNRLIIKSEQITQSLPLIWYTYEALEVAITSNPISD